MQRFTWCRAPRKFAVSLVCALFGAGLGSAQSPDLSVTNAEGTLRWTLNVSAGKASYQVDAIDGTHTTPVLESSPLGLARTDADFNQGLSLLESTPAKVVTDDYTLVAGKQRRIHSSGTERTFTLKNLLGMKVTITARAYKDGVAFRYGLPGSSRQLFFVSDETTGFKVPATGKIWAQPYSKVDKWAPGYEADYVNGIDVGTTSRGEEGWALPLLFHANDDWALITESGLEPTYFASHLQPTAPGGLYRVRLPEEAETYGVGPRFACITLPWLSPWRVVVIGRQPGAIADSTLVTDLARPSELQDTSWIKPGMAAWSWWSDTDSPRDYAKSVPFVDVAAKFHWPYSLVDLGWEDMKNGGDAKQLAEYAAKKNVGLILWYNSGGRHNDLHDAGMVDKMVDPLVRDAEMTRIAAFGIKGIKVDFMQSDKQYVIGLYHDILRDAARHKLFVDFHGATIPRGWNRTYPNLITMEAVRGAEQYWDKTFAENAQTFSSIYVFTRNAVGPMDYTPTIFTDPGAANPQLVPHLTTHAHELALLVVFHSGIQHVVDNAASLLKQPDYVQDYLTDLPTAWDESHVIAGSPGELAVVARRLGKIWYVSGINGQKTPQTIKVPLTFLGGGKYSLSLIMDGATPQEFAHVTRSANAKDVLDIALLGRGGFAARLKME